MGHACAQARGERVARDSRLRRSAGASERRDLCFFDALHTEGAFLHHAAHANGHVRIFLHLDRVRRALGRQRREIFFVDVECAHDLSLADRSLVVIEEIESTHLVGAVVRAKSRADAAVVSHDVETVLAVNGRVDGANRFARRVLAMLARHRLMHDLGILGPFAAVLVVRFAAGIIAINSQPMHDSAMRYL